MLLKPIRLTRRRAVFFVLALGVALCAVILLVSAADCRSAAARRGLVRSEADCIDYLASLGWETDAETVAFRDSVLPRTFDGVFADYAALQKQQGFDLSAWRGEPIVIYTARVTNYGAFEGGGEVWATVLVHANRVIGGDIHSTALGGFMHTLS